MKSRTYRVTLADLTKSSDSRTKEKLQWAAQCSATNSELLGEVDPQLLAKMDEMADDGTEQQLSAIFEQDDGATRGDEAASVRSARVGTLLGTQ